MGMPQLRLSGTIKSRKVPPAIAGPPNSPLGLRVSTTRQGVAGTNCRPGEARRWPITATVLLVRLPCTRDDWRDQPPRHRDCLGPQLKWWNR